MRTLLIRMQLYDAFAFFIHTQCYRFDEKIEPTLSIHNRTSFSLSFPTLSFSVLSIRFFLAQYFSPQFILSISRNDMNCHLDAKLLMAEKLKLIADQIKRSHDTYLTELCASLNLANIEVNRDLRESLLEAHGNQQDVEESREEQVNGSKKGVEEHKWEAKGKGGNSRETVLRQPTPKRSKSLRCCNTEEVVEDWLIEDWNRDLTYLDRMLPKHVYPTAHKPNQGAHYTLIRPIRAHAQIWHTRCQLEAQIPQEVIRVQVVQQLSSISARPHVSIYADFPYFHFHTRITPEEQERKLPRKPIRAIPLENPANNVDIAFDEENSNEQPQKKEDGEEKCRADATRSERENVSSEQSRAVQSKLRKLDMAALVKLKKRLKSVNKKYFKDVFERVNRNLGGLMELSEEEEEREETGMGEKAKNVRADAVETQQELFPTSKDTSEQLLPTQINEQSKENATLRSVQCNDIESLTDTNTAKDESNIASSTLQFVNSANDENITERKTENAAKEEANASNAKLPSTLSILSMELVTCQATPLTTSKKSDVSINEGSAVTAQGQRESEAERNACLHAEEGFLEVADLDAWHELQYLARIVPVKAFAHAHERDYVLMKAQQTQFHRRKFVH